MEHNLSRLLFLSNGSSLVEPEVDTEVSPSYSYRLAYG